METSVHNGFFGSGELMERVSNANVILVKGHFFKDQTSFFKDQTSFFKDQNIGLVIFQTPNLCFGLKLNHEYPFTSQLLCIKSEVYARGIHNMDMLSY